MEKKENITIVSEEPGIVCDNPACDYTDLSATGDLTDYVNKPCPKCGENLLTEEDWNSYKEMLATVQFINSLSPEELQRLNDVMPEEVKQKTLEQHPELTLEDLDTPVMASFKIKAHNGIHISDIKIEKP